MASTLACIGLDVDDLDTLNTHLAAMGSSVVGRVDGIEAVRYSDQSGARVVVTVDDTGETLDLVPSYDARPGISVGGLGPLGALAQADVLGEGGTLATRLAVDLEQRHHLEGTIRGPVRGSVVALGVEMAVHADETAFRASDASLIGDPDPSEPQRRWGAESFLSYGIFGDADGAEPTAFLAGTTLEAETRTHTVTGQAFHVVRVRTVGFEATVCLAARDQPTTPAPGSIVAGSCYLVLDVPTLWTVEPPRRRRRGLFAR